MKRLLLPLLLALGTLSALKAQSPYQLWQQGPPFIFEQVNAGLLKDQFGNLMTSGSMCWLGTDSTNTPITYTVKNLPGSVSTAWCGTVTKGIVSNLYVPNPAFITPAGVSFRVTITNTTGPVTVLTIPLVPVLNAPMIFWDSFVLTAINVGTSGIGQPRQACLPGAFYNQLDSTFSNPNWQCGISNSWFPLGSAPPSGGGSFTNLTGGTNTQAAMVVGTGASLGATGAGTITATDTQYKQGSTAVQTTLNTKARLEQLSILDFGCDPTGAVGIATSGCFAAAETAAAIKNQVLRVPAGIYSVDALLTINTPLQLVCDSGAILNRTYSGPAFIPAANNISITNCQFDGQFTQSGYTADLMDTAASGSFTNWQFTNLVISNVGGRDLFFGNSGATVSGVHISGGMFNGSSHDNGGGVVVFGPGISNVVMDGAWSVNQLNEMATPSTDGIQMAASISSGIHPLQNITVRDGVVNYVGGKIPIEMGNYCANPCNFYGGPIMIDNVTINSLYTGSNHGYGSGLSFGNGIWYSTVQNSTINQTGTAPGPSECIEIAQGSYNTISNNTCPETIEVNAGGSFNRITGNRITVATNGYQAIYIGDTTQPESINSNEIDHNTITVTAVIGSATFAIWMQNNTSSQGTFNEDHNTIHDNTVTYTDSGCQTSSTFCQGIRFENDGATGGMAYNSAYNNVFYGTSYPMAFSTSALILHTQFHGNIYDTTNFNQFIGGQTATNTDTVADIGTGSGVSWLMPGGGQFLGPVSSIGSSNAGFTASGGTGTNVFPGFFWKTTTQTINEQLSGSSTSVPNILYRYDPTASKFLGVETPFQNGTCAGCFGWGGNTNAVSSLPFLVDQNGNLAKIKGVSYTWPSANATGCFFDNGAGVISLVSCSSTGSPGGASNSVQYNNSGAFAGLALTADQFVQGTAAAPQAGTLLSCNSTNEALQYNTSTHAFGCVTITTLSNPMTTLGDVIYGGASGTPTRLAGNTTTTLELFTSLGTGSVSAAPVLHNLSDIMDTLFGTTQGSVIYRDASGWNDLGPGTAGQCLQTGGTAANPTWGACGSGGSGGPNPTAFQTTLSGLVLTVNAACSSSTPCNYAVGNHAYSFTGSGTATLSGSTSGVIYEYLDDAGNLTFGSLATLTCTGTGVTCVTSSSSFPANSFPLYSCPSTGGSSIGTCTDFRAWANLTEIIAGSNVTVTQLSSGKWQVSSSGGTSVSMLPPYIQIGSTLYDGTYAVTLPSVTGSNITGFTYDFGGTTNTANTNGDFQLVQSSSTQAAFYGQGTSKVSIEADFSLIGGQIVTEGGIWMFDGTFYWSLEFFNNGVSAATSYFMSLNKYNSSGTFSSSTVNGMPINGHAIIRESVSGTTLTYAVSINDGASFLPIATATVGTIQRTGFVLSKVAAGTNSMDLKSLVLH